MDSVAYADAGTLNGLNLYAYCLNNPVMNIDPSGSIVISIGAVILTGIIAFFATLVIIEPTTHLIENATNNFVRAIDNFFYDVSIYIDSHSPSYSPSINNSNISSSTINESISDINSILDLNLNIFNAKKGKYEPKRRGVRVTGKSKKDAEEKARRRGGGKKPRFHKGNYSEKLGKWIRPHYHPGVPENHPFYHDHYFYSLFFLSLGIKGMQDMKE